MRVMALLVMWFSATTALAPAAHAQPTPTQTQTQTQPNAQQQRREKIKQRIRALRAYTLTEQLELDEATAAKLFPALAKYDDEFDKLLQARADLQRRLDGAGALKDAKAIDKLIDEAVANQRSIWDTEAKRLEQLRKILTPAQVARVLIVLPAMERKIQNQLRKVTQRKGRAGGGLEGSGELKNLGSEDFDKRDDVADPFDAPKPPAKKPAEKSSVCDPFGTARGCSK